MLSTEPDALVPAEERDALRAVRRYATEGSLAQRVRRASQGDRQMPELPREGWRGSPQGQQGQGRGQRPAGGRSWRRCTSEKSRTPAATMGPGASGEWVIIPCLLCSSLPPLALGGWPALGTLMRVCASRLLPLIRPHALVRAARSSPPSCRPDCCPCHGPRAARRTLLACDTLLPCECCDHNCRPQQERRAVHRSGLAARQPPACTLCTRLAVG